MKKQRKRKDKETTLLNTLEAEFGSLSELRGLALDSSPKLIAYLLESSAEFSAFFSKVGEVVVFEREKFLEFLRLKMRDKSYTAFGTSIGLRLERQELQGTDRVVLDFPYKDCVLKGGQGKDEQKGKTTKKYEEIFFHNVIAGSEIDCLLAPKALQNFELVGHSSCTAISAESAKIAQSLTSSKLNRDFFDNPQTSGTILECQTSATSHTSKSPALSQSMSNTPHSQSLHNPDFSSQSLECQDSTALESTTKTTPNPQSSHSHTANTRIVDSSPCHFERSEKSAAEASLRAGGSLRGNPQDERESTNTPAFKATNERERERENSLSLKIA